VSAIAQRDQGKLKVIHMNIDAEEVKPYLDKYNVRGTPTLVLLDRHGRIAANVPGWPGDNQVNQALDRLIAQP
jgi:thioredoxin-related protein